MWRWQRPGCFSFFFFNDTATTEIYTLSLHDALPISVVDIAGVKVGGERPIVVQSMTNTDTEDVTSTVNQVMALARSEEHTSELQSQSNLVCRLLLEKKK